MIGIYLITNKVNGKVQLKKYSMEKAINIYQFGKVVKKNGFKPCIDYPQSLK